jgi:hypothetical protein
MRTRPCSKRTRIHRVTRSAATKLISTMKLSSCQQSPLQQHQSDGLPAFATCRFPLFSGLALLFVSFAFRFFGPYAGQYLHLIIEDIPDNLQSFPAQMAYSRSNHGSTIYFKKITRLANWLKKKKVAK